MSNASFLSERAHGLVPDCARAGTVSAWSRRGKASSIFTSSGMDGLVGQGLPIAEDSHSARDCLGKLDVPTTI